MGREVQEPVVCVCGGEVQEYVERGPWKPPKWFTRRGRAKRPKQGSSCRWVRESAF